MAPMRIHTKAFAMASGGVAGLGFFGVTTLATLSRWPHGLDGLAPLLPGYSVSFVGSLCGLLYGFLFGAAGGGSFSWLYNRVYEWFLSLEPMDPVPGPEPPPENPQVIDPPSETSSPPGLPMEAAAVEKSQQNDLPPLEKASQFWGERARQKQDETQPIITWTESPLVLRLYVHPAISGTADENWMIWTAKKYFPRPVPRALSIGCGDGCLERHALHLNVADRFEAFDVSPQAVEIAQCKAAELGFAERVSYQVADLNCCVLEPGRYDAAFASMSLHHIEQLEHLLAEIERALKPGSLFVVHEYVGPDQFQWSDTQLRLANELLLRIPEHFRKSLYTGQLKDKVMRQTREQLTAGDPTESIRSSEIVPLLTERFDVLERIDFGGTLLHPVLEEIAGNFQSVEEDIAVLESVFEFERRLLRDGVITSDFALIVARKKS